MHQVTDNDSAGNTGGEGHDRSTIGLPGQQSKLVSLALAWGGPLVAIILSGGSVSSDALRNASQAAVVYAGFGGESGQQAIVDVLFGDADASGRLPFTVYKEEWGEATPMHSMSFQAGQGRSYKYLTTTPLYRFGAGLSYSTFSLRTFNTTVVALDPTPTSVCATLTNNGKRSSSMVVTLYAKANASALINPPRIMPASRLLDFQRTSSLTPGATANVCFEVTDSQLAFYMTNGDRVVVPGSYVLEAFDGVSRVEVQATVGSRRKVSTLPPPDNPVPACCDGKVRTCC